MTILSALASKWTALCGVDETGLFEDEQPPIPETAHWCRSANWWPSANDLRPRELQPPPMPMGYREAAARRAEQDANSAAYNLVALPF